MQTPVHDPSDSLIRTLKRLRTRLTLQLVARHALHGTWIGATAALLWLVASRLFPVLGNPVPVAGGLVVTAVVIGFALALARRPSLLSTALEADRRLNLRERITSSLELAGAEGPMVAAVHADARRQLESRNAIDQFGFELSRASRWAIVPIVLFGLGYLFLPEFDLLNHRERSAEARELDKANTIRIDRLKEAVKPLAEAQSAEDGELADALNELDALANDLESGAINEKQALARMGNLADKLAQQRQALAAGNPDMKLAIDQAKLSVARELANALQEGRMGDAAQKAAEIQKKLASATSEDEKKKLREDLEALSEMLKKSDSALNQALANAMTDASTAMQNGNMDEAQASLEEMLSELQDAQSVIDQLASMDTAMQQLDEWQAENMGPSDYCRQCGAELSECDKGDGECDSAGHKHSGLCQACASGNGLGQGMRGAGHGQGGQVGELPEIEAGFTPTKAQGPITKGKMIAEILQRSAPETGEHAETEYLPGAFVEMRQEAEQALVQEEIPPASKEYVRQYFGSLEPEEDAEAGR